MGGEGAMMAMITSLRNNSRRKNIGKFSKDTIGSYGEGKKVEFDFPEVTPQVLKAIRDKLQKEGKQMTLKIVGIFLIVITVLVVLII